MEGLLSTGPTPSSFVDQPKTVILPQWYVSQPIQAGLWGIVIFIPTLKGKQAREGIFQKVEPWTWAERCQMTPTLGIFLTSGRKLTALAQLILSQVELYRYTNKTSSYVYLQ